MRLFRPDRDLLRHGLWVTTALCAAAFVVQVVPPFPRLFVRMFVSAGNQALVDLATHDLAVANCMIWTISVNVVVVQSAAPRGDRRASGFAPFVI